MDEAMLKSGQYPNVAIMAGTDPAEVMREHGQVIQNGEKYELADADPAEDMREHVLEGCGGWVEYCMQHGDSLGEALLHADEICRAERAESIARIAKQEVDKQADSRDHSKTECSHSNVSKNLSDTREQLEADELPSNDACAILRKNLYGVGDLGRAMGILEPNELVGGSGDRAYIFERLADLIERDYVRRDGIAELTAERDALKKLISQSDAPEPGESTESGIPKDEICDFDDSREQLEADILAHYKTPEEKLKTVREWLDRQAVITERKASEWHKKFCAWCEQVTDRRIAELTAEVEKHRQRANDAERGVLSDEWYVARDRYEDDVAALTAERDEWRTKCETREFAYKQADAERKRYSKQIDSLIAERDILKERVARFDSISSIDGIANLLVQFEDLTAERDELEMRVNSLVAELGDAEGSANILERQRDELKAELKTANDTINTLRASVAGLKGTVEKLRAR